jgi:hypothetical protein
MAVISPHLAAAIIVFKLKGAVSPLKKQYRPRKKQDTDQLPGPWQSLSLKKAGPLNKKLVFLFKSMMAVV